MIRVILESPYKGDVEKNLTYLRRCLRDCLKRGEAPFASHGLYTQKDVLDDNDPEERKLGIEAGLQWGIKAEKSVVYVDKGISDGMVYGILRAGQEKRPVEFRALYHVRKCASCVLDAFGTCADCADEMGEMMPEKRERYYKRLSSIRDDKHTERQALLDIKLHHGQMTAQEEDRLEEIREWLDADDQRRMLMKINESGKAPGFFCKDHPKEEVGGEGGMCWICIKEDDDFRKHRKKVWGS